MSDVRKELADLMRETLADHGNWDYRAVRPLDVPSDWRPGQHVVADCSKGVQYLARWADAPDPMGNAWADWGNSTTIALNLVHLPSASALKVGDAVTFGWNGSEHAAMVLEVGNDPLLWSHGHQGAPNTYRLSWDRRVHQYLRLPVADHKPTPDELLRAKTGYWSWVQWKLGEGAWKGKGKENPKVRPNVPDRIPVVWWKQYAAFLAARRPKRANPPTLTPKPPAK